MVYITASGDIVQKRPGESQERRKTTSSLRSRSGNVSTLGDSAQTSVSQQSSSFGSTNELSNQGAEGADGPLR